MIGSHPGELAALATACCWTITAMSFEAAGKRIGSLVVNLLRLTLGFGFLCLYAQIFRGLAFPVDATARTWLWLSISGVVGFFLGDLFLFRAFVLIGSRISMLIMASVPPFTALMGWALMGERLAPIDFLGMTLTLGGIALVVLKRPRRGVAQAADTAGGMASSATAPAPRRSRPLSGILFAFGGSLGQAAGLVLSKYGMDGYDAFAATQIRGVAGIVGFVALFCVARRWGHIRPALRNRRAMSLVTLGAFFGPFLGVSLSLLLVKFTTTGVASTIMAIVPVLIIPPAVLFFRERVTVKEVLGAVLAVGGVCVLFL